MRNKCNRSKRRTNFSLSQNLGLPSIMIASSVSYTFALTNTTPNAPIKNSSKKSLSTIFRCSWWKSLFPTNVPVWCCFTFLWRQFRSLCRRCNSSRCVLDLDLDFKPMKELNQNKWKKWCYTLMQSRSSCLFSLYWSMYDHCQTNE